MPAMTIEEIHTCIDALFRAYNDHDLDGVVALFTEDVVWEPDQTFPVIGRAAAAGLLRSQFRAFPDLHFPKEEIVVYTSPDGKAASKWHMVATMTGRLYPPGYAPTGKTADCTGMCAYEFRDGLICRHTVVYDVMGFSQKLGLLAATPA